MGADKPAWENGKLLSNMIVLAVNKHAGQFDKSGRPYILHPFTVMLMDPLFDEEQQCIAIGHDIIEDTNCTYKELREAGMTERIIEGIRCLTKVPGETYDEYRVKVKSNKDSIKVKKCDLHHNSDLMRLKSITEKDIKRVVKYQAFYHELCEAELA